jgi:hypothetical protein
MRTGERLHFEYDWRALADLNPAYDSFVRAEIARLGEAHPSIQTQYLLQCLATAGRLFSLAQREAIQGDYGPDTHPNPDLTYVAGIDLAGEDEEAEDARWRALSPQRDSTVVTIAAVDHRSQGEPVVRVIAHVWWTGREHVWQYERLVRLWQEWGLSGASVDASGIGAGIAAFLSARFPGRVERVIFSAAVKSRLAFGMLAKANTGRLHVYRDEDSIAWREFWKQVAACRYQLRAGEIMSWSVPATEGHDDFVVSLALCCRAADGLAPPGAGTLMRATSDDEVPGW